MPDFIMIATHVLLGVMLLCLSGIMLFRGKALMSRERAPAKKHYDEVKEKLVRLYKKDKAVNKINNGLEEQAEQIMTLFETAKNIGSTLEFENIFKIVYSTVRSLYAFSRGELVLYSTAGQKLEIESTHEFADNDQDAHLVEQPAALSYRIASILKNRSKKALIYIENVEQSLLARQLHLPGDTDSFVIVPLITAEEDIGFLTLANIKSPARPGQEAQGVSSSRPVIEWLAILAPQFALGIKKAKLYKQVQEFSITDGLTKLYLRRFIMERFEEELSRSQRFDLKMSVIMADIDLFKNINDRYGHLVGDVILEKIASSLKQNVREIDLVGKYGGEEFIIILPETDINEAKQITQRLCEIIAGEKYRAYDENLTLTLSFGVATFPDHAARASDLILAADDALYQAKEEGRNRVITAGTPRREKDKRGQKTDRRDQEDRRRIAESRRKKLKGRRRR